VFSQEFLTGFFLTDSMAAVAQAKGVRQLWSGSSALKGARRECPADGLATMAAW
jgi:hypothetical protein